MQAWTDGAVTPTATGQDFTKPRPVVCLGNVHVWACEHTEYCQCGVAQRMRPIVTPCPHCGQR
jgi:hypothetical protein